MYDTLNKYHLALSPLLFPSLAQGFWEPDLKQEAFSGQEPVTLPSIGAGVLNQGVRSGWARAPRLCPHLHVGHALPSAPNKAADRSHHDVGDNSRWAPNSHNHPVLTAVAEGEDLCKGNRCSTSCLSQGTEMANLLAYSSGALQGPSVPQRPTLGWT